MPNPDPDPSAPLELEEATQPFTGAPPDKRPLMPEPLPVRLIAVEDVRLDTVAGIEDQLDDFYVRMLEFERLPGELVYRAENVLLRFTVHERPPVRESLRPLGVIVLSLADAERKIIERELEYTRQRGMTPGSQSLLLLDPAGNWVEIVEDRRVF